MIAGGAAVAAGVAYRFVRRRQAPAPAPEAGSDPRAEALRQKLAESRDVLSEQEDFEGGETPIDAVEDVEDIDERRRSVHERGRETLEGMHSDD